jgi:hypothetical protein
LGHIWNSFPRAGDGVLQKPQNVEFEPRKSHPLELPAIEHQLRFPDQDLDSRSIARERG